VPVTRPLIDIGATRTRTNTNSRLSRSSERPALSHRNGEAQRIGLAWHQTGHSQPRLLVERAEEPAVIELAREEGTARTGNRVPDSSEPGRRRSPSLARKARISRRSLSRSGPPPSAPLPWRHLAIARAGDSESLNDRTRSVSRPPAASTRSPGLRARYPVGDNRSAKGKATGGEELSRRGCCRSSDALGRRCRPLTPPPWCARVAGLKGVEGA